MNYCIGWALAPGDFAGALRTTHLTRRLAAIAYACLAFFPAGCASLEQYPHPNEAGARAVQALPGWQDETAAGLRAALAAQCQLVRLHKPWPSLCAELASHAAQITIPGPDAQHLAARRVNDADSLPLADSLPDAVLKHWITHHFEAWPIVDNGGTRSGLLTGYFEPTLSGSRERESDSQVALYAPPPDLVAGVAYMTRAQIEAQAIDDEMNKRALVWIDDPVNAFFLHIQGSGRIRLRDNSVLRVGFAAHNNQPYFAIGRELVRRGALAKEQVSAQAIKQWLRSNQPSADAVMQTNPRYIFFRELPPLPDHAGPPGSMQVPLTRLRSVATDKRFVPAGSLLYLDSRLPGQKPGQLQNQLSTSAPKPARVGLTLSQDTGGAIAGQIRADLFIGTGHQAGELAGQMRQPLQMWLLWPKGATPPPAVPVARQVINR